MELLIGICSGILLGFLNGKVKGISSIFLLINLASGSSINIFQIIVAEAFSISAVSKKYKWTFLFVKAVAGICVATIILLGQAEIFKLTTGLAYVGVAIAIGMWIIVVNQSKVPLFAWSTFIAFCAIGIVVSKLPYTNNVLCLVMAIYGIPNLLESLRINPPKNTTNKNEMISDSIDIYGVMCGIVGGLFWGIPHRAACKAIATKDEQLNLMNTCSEAGGSMLALGMVLSGGGARTGAASMIGSVEFPPIAVVAMLIANLAVTGIIYLATKNLNDNQGNNKAFSLISIAMSVCFIVFFQGTTGIILIVTGLLLHRMIKFAGSPKEISLASISIIPLWGLI